MKKAFTLIELVFVIVIIGIISAVAIPKLQGQQSGCFTSKKVLKQQKTSEDGDVYFSDDFRTE